MVPAKCDVVVIGAGLSGLATARILSIAGRNVHVVEASDSIGGRVRTDEIDGLLLDRGFQLYNPSYDEGKRILDIDALDLYHLTAGVVITKGDDHFHIGNPLKDPSAIADSLTAPIGPFSQRFRFVKYAIRNAFSPVDFSSVDQQTGPFARFEFGEEFTERVLRPFLAGVFLEDELATSKRFFDVVLKSFVRGTPGVPARGMQAIPEQLAAQLPPESIHLNTSVTRIAPGRVTTNHGDIVTRAIVLATGAVDARALLPRLTTPATHAVTTWYHLADCPSDELTAGKGTLIVDADRYVDGNRNPQLPLVNTVAISNAAPSYATDGRVLISSSALGAHSDSEMESRVRAHLERLYGVSTRSWTHVATYPIAHALPAMYAPHAPSKQSHLGDGLYIAGDYQDVSSINGAFHSGRRTANEILASRR